MYYPEVYEMNKRAAYRRIIEACKTLAEQNDLPTEGLEQLSQYLETEINLDKFNAEAVADTLESVIGAHWRIVKACKALTEFRGLSTKDIEQSSRISDKAAREQMELESVADMLEAIIIGRNSVDKAFPLGIT